MIKYYYLILLFVHYFQLVFSYDDFTIGNRLENEKKLNTFFLKIVKIQISVKTIKDFFYS